MAQTIIEPAGARLLLDLPENGRVDLRKNPADPGDLKHYLPGYSLVKADNSGNERPEIGVTLISPPSTAPSGWTSANVTWKVEAQRVFVVCHVPIAEAGFVDFKIEDVSRFPGVACNLLVEKTQPFQRDFYFKSGDDGGESDERKNVPINLAKSEARVELFCRDFGGWCRIRAVVRQRARISGVAEMTVPRLQDGLPKRWRERAEFGGRLDDDEDLFATPSGEAHPPQEVGDGLSGFEEYRGFFIGGRHWRLDVKKSDGGTRGTPGGPRVKDVFVVDRVGTYRKIDASSIGELTPPTRSFGGNRFLDGYRMVFHLVHPWEVGFFPPLLFGGTLIERFGPVNFNSDADQCPAAFVPASATMSRALGTQVLADALHGVVNLRAPDGRIYTIPVLVNREAFVSLFPKRRDEDGLIDALHPQLGSFFDHTYAHELGHRFGLSHPTVEFNPSVKPLPPPLPGFARPTLHWVDVDTIGRRVVRYWGIVDPGVRRHAPHLAELEPHQFGFSFLEVLRFTHPETGQQAYFTKVKHLGQIKFAGIYSYELPAGHNPMVLDQLIAEFRDTLMDEATQWSGLQFRITPAEQGSMDLTKTKALPLDELKD